MRILLAAVVLALNLGNLCNSQAQQTNFVTRPFDQTEIDSTRRSVSPGKSPKGAMLRSLAFPGLGQWYNQQKIKATLVVATQGVLIGLRFHFANKANDYLPGSLQRADYNDRRNQTYWFMGAVVLVSMLDAYIDAHLFDFDTGPDLTMKTGVEAETSHVLQASKYVGLTLKVRF